LVLRRPDELRHRHLLQLGQMDLAPLDVLVTVVDRRIAEDVVILLAGKLGRGRQDRVLALNGRRGHGLALTVPITITITINPDPLHVIALTVAVALTCQGTPLAVPAGRGHLVVAAAIAITLAHGRDAVALSAEHS